MPLQVFVHCTDHSPSIVPAFIPLHHVALFSGSVREYWYKIQLRHFWLPSNIAFVDLDGLARLQLQSHTMTHRVPGASLLQHLPYQYRLVVSI
jgi:hypothetical protein